jgi:hypothetical protein
VGGKSKYYREPKIARPPIFQETFVDFSRPARRSDVGQLHPLGPCGVFIGKKLAAVVYRLQVQNHAQERGLGRQESYFVPSRSHLLKMI